jgi:hypothetical protein
MGELSSGNRGCGLVEIDLTVAVAGVSSWVDVPNVSPSNIGFGVDILDGAPTYTVQHRFGAGPAFDHPFVQDQTINTDGNYFFPISQIRIESSAGRVRLRALIPGLNDRVIAESV